MHILIADDHALVRETIAAFLVSECEASVVTVGTFPEALKEVAQSCPFDLVLLDYDMPGMNGLIGLSDMVSECGGTPVALMSGTANRALVVQAIRKGAAGFIPKTIGSQSMITAAQFMVSGETYIPVDLMRKKEDQKLDLLSKREREVLYGICQGQSNKEISRQCQIQEATVKLHAKTLYEKLGARNRAHAGMIAREYALV